MGLHIYAAMSVSLSAVMLESRMAGASIDMVPCPAHALSWLEALHSLSHCQLHKLDAAMHVYTSASTEGAAKRQGAFECTASTKFAIDLLTHRLVR